MNFILLTINEMKLLKLLIIYKNYSLKKLNKFVWLRGCLLRTVGLIKGRANH